jgi:cytochrome c oxidase cbb3-type subunit 2
MIRWKPIVLFALAPAALALAQGARKPAAHPPPASAPQGQRAAADEEKPPNPPRPLDAAKAARGKVAYQRYCISCHGERGDGRGYSAPWLDPKPRDFTRAIFKCRSTPNGTLPDDKDLVRTLREGLYHTNMPSWAVLGDPPLHELIEYLKTFSPRWKEEGPGDPIKVVAEPPDDAASRAKGKNIWNAQACFNCHGQTGKGDGPSVPTLFDDWGYHDAPFDFTASPRRKCGATDQDLYRTFLTGMNGTPMPSFADTVSAEDAWHLVHFLKTLQTRNTEQGIFRFSMGP